jgi:diguanylate cyclase (GGDEF)-like protein
MLAEPDLQVAREQERLCALDRYDVLDTPPEEAFDRITRLARHIFDVPVSAVTLIDGHRQWFKSRQGLDAPETDLPPSLCHKVVLQGAPLIVENALADPRVQTNPCVTGEFGLRFYAGIPLRTADGHDLGALCVADTKPRDFGSHKAEILSDLARIVMSELELRTLATTDALTGSLSRRAFRDEASRALALAQRHRHSLSCLMLDLDHFKRINDTYGHSTGDLVLTEVIHACRATLRSSDLIGRLGGEEFAILLHQTGQSAALDVAEKLRAAVARLRFAVAGEAVSVTASFGASTLDRSVTALDTLLERADSALYASKADGRNRCSVWHPPAEVRPPDTRRRVLKAGRIAFNGGRSTIDCTVRSLSEREAGLAVTTTADIPDQFKLHILADELHRACTVIGRSDRHMEVAFG